MSRKLLYFKSDISKRNLLLFPSMLSACPEMQCRLSTTGGHCIGGSELLLVVCFRLIATSWREANSFVSVNGFTRFGR